jgi:drug/metabolite transporter (DMT)-like permease
MVLVILAAACVAAFALLFRAFGRNRIALVPAISINYITAFILGLIVHPPWGVGDLSLLAGPSVALGLLFMSVFLLIGRSAQEAGAAITTIAARMSLVITVLVSAWVFKEDPGPAGWCGIAIALAAMVLANFSRRSDGSGRSLWLPMVILVGSALCDLGVGVIHRTRTTEMNEQVLPTLCFGGAALTSLLFLAVRGELGALGKLRVVGAGSALGIINYASLIFLVGALSTSGIPATVIFPLMNICTILIGLAASMVLFKERLTRLQWVGVAGCMVALALLMWPHQ